MRCMPALQGSDLRMVCAQCFTLSRVKNSASGNNMGTWNPIYINIYGTISFTLVTKIVKSNRITVGGGGRAVWAQDSWSNVVSVRCSCGLSAMPYSPLKEKAFSASFCGNADSEG
mgnify:CR=1 FL=1